MSPRVSIGLPVYNGERYLAETLASILGQDYGNFELIISDNASTDATQDICEDHARHDRRVHYSRLPENLGAAPNYNRVVHASTGELFKWAAHDDLLHPAFLSRCVAAFDGREVPPAIVHPRAEFIDESSRVVRPDLDRMRATSSLSWLRAFQTLQAMNMTAPIMGLFHRPTLLKTRLIGSFVGSDYVLLLEAGLLGRIIQLDGEPLFQRRVHPEMSRQANRSAEDALRWFDPKARVTLSLRQKLYLEYLRAPVAITDLGAAEKVLCAGAIVSGVSYRRTRVFLGKHRRRLMSRFGGGTS